jgi:CRP/FNR family transcriptional regulator
LPEQPSPSSISPELSLALTKIQSTLEFREGEVLFQQASPALGVYIVESGQVRILLSTGHSDKQLLEVARPRTMLGLSETMCGGNYRATAEAASALVTSFIVREKLLALLRENTAFSMEIVRLLSEELHVIYEKFRSISAHPGRPRRRDLNVHLN